MKKIISFCITVYNQIDLLKDCLDSIVSYTGDDIEIIVSDDRSSDDIRGLINCYHDSRIRYFLNETNLGHDRNILRAISHSEGEYAFVLRTRDKIIADAIPIMIKAARFGDASYITGAAVNQDGEVKLQYLKEVYKCGREAIDANYKLFIHPSGNMYRVNDLDLNSLNYFLDEKKVSKTGFIVHNLIRLYLATTGNFRLIKDPIWVYFDTEKAKDRAVNHSTDGKSVYDPSLIEKRYVYEVEWAKRILGNDDYRFVLFRVTEFYLDQATWGFKLSNNDKRIQFHYGYDRVCFSIRRERERIKIIYQSFFDHSLRISNVEYNNQINEIIKRNKVNGAIKYFIKRILARSSFYNLASRVYSRFVKRI